MICLLKRARWLSFALVLSIAAAAVAAGSQSYSQKFTVKHPGKPTGMTVSAAGPVQPKTITLTFPAGTKINQKATPRCTPTLSCPGAALLGSGTATVRVIGVTQPMPITVYNRKGGLLLLVLAPGTGNIPLEPTLSGRTLTLSVPALPVTLKALKLTINKVGKGLGAYMRTPATCPKTGVWKFTARFAYPNGTSTTRTSRSACVKH
jgi:hypothetical protein